MADPITVTARHPPGVISPARSRRKVSAVAKKQMSTRRRLTISTWKPPRDGVIFGTITLDCSNALKYMEEIREATGDKVTITAFVGAAVARALRDEPTLNGRIHLGKYIPYDKVTVSYLVQVGEGQNLAQVRIEDADNLSAIETAERLRAQAGKVRSGEDKNFEKSTNMAAKMPTWLLRRVLSLSGYVTTGMGKPFAGQPAYPFGSCIITSIGMLGVDEAFVPPTPFARVPLYVAIGAVRDMVFAEDGQPVVRPGITVTATMDHRFVDGFQAATVARSFRKAFNEPTLLGAIPTSSAEESGQESGLATA